MSIFRKKTFRVGKTCICDHNEKLASGDQKNNFHFVTIIFFFVVCYLGKIYCILYIKDANGLQF